MPIDETVLAALVDAARLSTAELERISQSTLGTALGQISSASTPAQQAADMSAYAVQYGLVRELAAALLYTGADRPGLQNLLLGDETMNQTEDQRHTATNSLDIVRLENRVGRVEDRVGRVENGVDTLAQQVQSLLQRTPLNWNIVGWGVVLAILAGVTLWAITAAN